MVERVLEERQRRPRRDENGDVAESGRAPTAASVVDRPSFARARATVAATSCASALRSSSAWHPLDGPRVPITDTGGSTPARSCRVQGGNAWLGGDGQRHAGPLRP